VGCLALDTSVIVAGLQSWHAHHEVTSALLIEVLASEEEVVIPLPALVEAYSVMTRLPAPRRLPPAKALEMLESSFAGRVRIVALPADAGWRFLRDIAEEGVAGGATYDAHVLDAAVAAGADRVLTLNVADFERLQRPGVTVISPLSRS
jgi:predicted nucleic acid-binding protein